MVTNTDKITNTENHKKLKPIFNKCKFFRKNFIKKIKAQKISNKLPSKAFINLDNTNNSIIKSHFLLK